MHIECANCSAGFAYTSINDTCFACPSGWIQPYDRIQSGSACKVCDRGKEFVNTSYPCKLCARGMYQPSNKTESVNCSVCPSGKIAVEEGMSACTDCEVNTFNGFTEAAPADTHDSLGDCARCPEGQSTKNLTGEPFCSPCPSGKFTLEYDSWKEIRCVECPSGWKQRSFGQRFCEECPAGEYQASQGQTNCVVCEAGRMNTASGQDGCIDCPIGRYRTSNISATTCASCPRGQHQIILHNPSVFRAFLVCTLPPTLVRPAWIARRDTSSPRPRPPPAI